MSLGMNGVVNLKNLPKCDPIYLGQTEEEGLHFRDCEVTIAGKTRKLELAELLAMALTERCSEIGVGMVYYYLPFDPIKPRLALDPFPDVRRKAAALSDLIYMQHNWTKMEQCNWTRKSHKNRYILLDGRQFEEDEDETQVLPISIAHYRYKPSPRLNLDTACTGMLYLDPCPKLGLTCDMLSAWTRFHFLGYREMDNCWMNAMEKFELALPNGSRMDDLDGVLERLKTMQEDDINEHVIIDLFGIYEVDASIAEDLGISSDMGHTREEEPDETEDSIEVDLTDENED